MRCGVDRDRRRRERSTSSALDDVTMARTIFVAQNITETNLPAELIPQFTTVE